MKPGDHPDFFRLPPPEGRSRESSLRLDAEGRFWHEGNPVEHAGMALAFASWVQRHPDDGRYILNNGYDWSYLQVEDTPFHVRAVRPDADGRELSIELSDGSTELLDPAALELSAEGVLYMAVKQGAFRARFARGAQLALAPWLSEAADGAVFLDFGGRRWSMPNTPPEA